MPNTRRTKTKNVQLYSFPYYTLLWLDIQYTYTYHPLVDHLIFHVETHFILFRSKLDDTTQYDQVGRPSSLFPIIVFFSFQLQSPQMIDSP